MSIILKRIMNAYTLWNKVERDTSFILRTHKKNHAKNYPIILKILSLRKYNRMCIRYGCFFPMSCTIGNNPVFPHGLFGIFISQDAVIGDNCCIFQQVTIGSNNLNDSLRKGAPTIGNNVYIGAGAKIIGNCHIGNNVRVGANTIVTKDIPDNATVINSEVRVIEHAKAPDNTFVAR